MISKENREGIRFWFGDMLCRIGIHDYTYSRCLRCWKRRAQ